MTSSTSTQPDQLDADTIGAMVRSTLASLPLDPDAPEEDTAADLNAAVCALRSLRPRDPAEAMLAARIVSAHHAAMECFRRAAQPGISDITALRLHNKAISLASLAMRTQRELQKCQAAPPAYPVPAEQEQADEPQLAPATKATPARAEPGAPVAPAHSPNMPIAPDCAMPPPTAVRETALAV
jgi:hypothetical protein